MPRMSGEGGLVFLLSALGLKFVVLFWGVGDSLSTDVFFAVVVDGMGS